MFQKAFWWTVPAQRLDLRFRSQYVQPNFGGAAVSSSQILITYPGGELCGAWSDSVGRLGGSGVCLALTGRTPPDLPGC